MSGSVTISSSGVPARLRSMPVRPWKSSCSDLPASSSRWARVVHGRLFLLADSNVEPAALHDRQLELADLVALGQVGVEVVLAREHRARLMVAPTARPNLMALDHGFAIEHRQHARQGDVDAALACRLGSAPKAVLLPENIFETVAAGRGFPAR
jgi:hypothetical protein